MKLIIAIIHNDLSHIVMKTLVEKKIRATKLSSTGGFLKTGNTTLLIGAEDEELESILELIRLSCNISPDHPDKDEDMDISSATIFILDIDDYERI